MTSTTSPAAETRLPRSLRATRLFPATVCNVARGSAGDFFTLGCLWLVMVLITNPAGNFPLDDDWSYGRAVKRLVEHGEFHLTGFTGMPLVAQVVWGALFCLPGGFSFTALRVSTLVLGFVGVLATYALLRETRASRALAFFGGVVVATTPLYFVLAFTFMTDVPFFAFATLAMFLLVRGTLRDRKVELLLGFLFAGIALLVRQTGLIVIVSFALAYLLRRGITRVTLSWTVVPVGVAVAVLLGYEQVLKLTTGIPVLYNKPYDPIAEAASGVLGISVQLLDRVFVAMLYLGLFLLPFTIVAASHKWKILSRAARRSSALAAGAAFTTTIGGLLWADRSMPFSGNILFDTGLGPPLLRDVYFLNLPHLPRAPRVLWLMVTIAAVAGAVLILLFVMSAIRRIARQRTSVGSPDYEFPATFALIGGILFLGLIAVTGYLDRYLLFALPLVLMVIAGPQARASWRSTSIVLGAATVLLALYGLFGLVATHDYLSWNRARWIALRELTEDAKISYREIDGGFEFNGWIGYDPAYRLSPDKPYWWVYDDEYIVSFGPLARYRTWKEYSYERWIPLGKGKLFVLRRLE